MKKVAIFDFEVTFGNKDELILIYILSRFEEVQMFKVIDTSVIKINPCTIYEVGSNSSECSSIGCIRLIQ